MRARSTDRSIWVALALLLVLLVLVVVGLALGKSGVTPSELFDVVRGQGTKAARFVLVELRLPRTLTAVLVGLTFGLSGGIVQSLARNPLASPDIIGLTAGASAAGVIGIVLFGLSGLALSGVALLGAFAVAVIVYLLAGAGHAGGLRFVLIGIAVAAMASALVSIMLTRGDLNSARDAYVWLTGSLSGANWQIVSVLAVVSVVLVPAALALARPLGILELGDDTAAGLGVALGRTRLVALAVGVALTAVAVAAAGPIAFVALVSAPIARRMVGDGRLALVSSALVGAVVVLASDLVAQFALSQPLPVGVVTGVVGAPYLIWLLVRRASGGRS